MTVRELIARLETLHPEQRIVIENARLGCEDIDKIEEARLKLHYWMTEEGTERYGGPHEIVDDDEEADERAYILSLGHP